MAGVFLLGFPVHRVLDRLNIIDKPNERSSHVKPVARGGGLGIMGVIVMGSLLLRAWDGEFVPLKFVAVSLMLAGISFWDDLKSVRASIRLVSHMVSSLLSLVILGWSGVVWLENIPVPWQLLAATIGWSVGLLWITGYTNAFNFMDGINGLAGIQAVIASAGAAMLAVISGAAISGPPVLFSLLVAGAAAGFLPHNFPRARMFMGDVGSAPLGFLLASSLIWIASQYGWWLLIPLLMLHGNFVLDTGFTLVRRILNGEQWYAPHREHFYQRFIRAGRSHAFVTLWEAGLQCVTLVLMVLYVKAAHGIAQMALLAASLAVWISFFARAEYEFKSSIQSPRK